MPSLWRGVILSQVQTSFTVMPGMREKTLNLDNDDIQKMVVGV